MPEDVVEQAVPARARCANIDRAGHLDRRGSRKACRSTCRRRTRRRAAFYARREVVLSTAAVRSTFPAPPATRGRQRIRLQDLPNSDKNPGDGLGIRRLACLSRVQRAAVDHAVASERLLPPAALSRTRTSAPTSIDLDYMGVNAKGAKPSHPPSSAEGDTNMKTRSFARRRLDRGHAVGQLRRHAWPARPRCGVVAMLKGRSRTQGMAKLDRLDQDLIQRRVRHAQAAVGGRDRRIEAEALASIKWPADGKYIWATGRRARSSRRAVVA